MTEKERQKYVFEGRYHHDANMAPTKYLEIGVWADNQEDAKRTAKEAYFHYLGEEPSGEHEDYSIDLIKIEIHD